MYLGEMTETPFYAYVAEIITNPVFRDDKWMVIADIIWDKNGIPIRENCRILKFETKDQALALKVGDIADKRTTYQWID